MRKTQPLSLLLALTLLVAPRLAAAQEVCWFLGTAGGPGEVAVFDQATGLRLASVPELVDVALLPLDFTGRSALHELREDRPRLGADVPGAARIALPFARGSLYRFRRADAVGSGAAFGFFWINAGGTPRPLVERVDAAGIDPWLTKVAIAPDGQSFLAATTLAAGGDVLEVDLASGAVENRTALLPPLDVQANGLALLATWGVVTTRTGLLRFDRTPGAGAQPVALGSPAPAFFGDGVVCSDGGNMVAGTAGADAQSAHVWAFEKSGPAMQLSVTPMALSGPGFLPDAVAGPYLALSPDGSACLWRSEELTAEAWVRPTQLAAPPPVQVTRNAVFEDTLDSTGEFGFLDPTTALVVVGEADEAGGVDGADVYQVVLDPQSGATTVTNLSNTSGTLVPPFTKGTLKADAGVWQLEGFPGLLVFHDLSSNQGELAVVRAGQSGLQVLRTGVASVEAVARAGGRIGLITCATAGASELVSLPTTLDALTLHASLPSGFTLSAIAGRDDGWVGVLLDVPGGGSWIGRVHLPTSAAEVLIELALPLGRTLGFTPERLGFALDFTPQRSVGVTWGFGGQLGLYPMGGLPGFLLPIL